MEKYSVRKKYGQWDVIETETKKIVGMMGYGKKEEEFARKYAESLNKQHEAGLI